MLATKSWHTPITAIFGPKMKIFIHIMKSSTNSKYTKCRSNMIEMYYQEGAF